MRKCKVKFWQIFRPLKVLMRISGKLNIRDEGLKRSGEPLDYLLILLLLKRKEIVWWIWWMRHVVSITIHLLKIIVLIRGGCLWQVRVYWICNWIDLSLLILTFHCLQMTWVSSLLPRLLISDQSWMVSLHRIFRRRRSLIWHLNLAILYCLISNVRRLKQYVIWSHQGRKNLASWIQYQWLCYLHALTHSFL